MPSGLGELSFHEVAPRRIVVHRLAQVQLRLPGNSRLVIQIRNMVAGFVALIGSRGARARVRTEQ